MKPICQFVILFLMCFSVSYSETIGISVSASDLEINVLATYTFQLQRYINPLTANFIDPVISASVDSIIRIDMPSSYLPVSSETNPSCTNGNTGAALTCTVHENNKTIIVEGYYADSSTVADDTVTIVINNIHNPSRA